MINTDELTPYERAGMYTVLSKEETETQYIETIRTYDGATVINCIPKHTPEEDKALSRQITRALTKFAHPDIDIDTVEYMEIII
ncbi:MAG: hypothetical protein K2O36_04015 [Ruminococcus sp.]|nr:hypothetical protein [Ruminococcus sp.]